MPVSGVVITLSSDPELARAALEKLGRLPAVTLGEPRGQRLPAVLESDDLGSQRRLMERLQRVPGVSHVNLVYAVFDEEREPWTAESS